ncbi:LysR family transcriptional regulator [Pigmentiphaga litoralis]|uniref:LysR family transcriptional regulator n=1 Tax=Pigmentiphaga litoralis TaxID=516702 RepID=UPI00389ACA84
MSYRILQETAVRYFLEVARTGSIKEAALRLNVVPSAVSRQIARLEAELGTLLFDRHARGLIPNAAGELLASHAKRVQQEIERVTTDIHALRGVKVGRVRVASVDGLVHDFMPELIAQFRRSFAGIRVDLEVCLHGEVARKIRDGDADVGITLSVMPEPEIIVELRHPGPVLAIVSPQHPLAQFRQVALSQVVAYPLALPPAESSVRQLIDASCSRQGLNYEAVFCSNNMDSLAGLAGAGDGVIAFYGELSIRRRLAERTLVGIPFIDREFNERYLEIQTSARGGLSPAGRTFVECLKLAMLGV